MGMNLPPVIRERPDDAEVVPDYLYEKKQIPSLFSNNPSQQVWGVPGASLTWGIGGLRNTEVIIAGREGEKATGKLMRELADKHPGLYVFHSLRWPTSNGDTDHILLYKGLAFVVDTKRWKGTRKYSVTAKGSVLRGTVAFPEGRVKIGYALRTWRKYLPHLTVNGIVTIAQEKVFVVKDRNWFKAPFRLVEHEKFLKHVGDEIEKYEQQLVEGKKKAPSREEQLFTRCTLAGFLVAERDPRKGLIRGKP